MFVINPGRHVGLRGSQQGPVHTLVILSRRSLCPTPMVQQWVPKTWGWPRDRWLAWSRKGTTCWMAKKNIISWYIMNTHIMLYYVAYVLKHFALVCCCPYFAGFFRRSTVADEKLCRTFNTWRSQAMQETALKTLKVFKGNMIWCGEFLSGTQCRSLQGNSPGTKKMRLALALSKLGALLAM